MTPSAGPLSEESQARFSQEISLTVGGMLLWGIANYAIYAFAARMLEPEAFAAYALWWTALNVLSVGLFAPFESAGPHLVTSVRLRDGSDNHAARWLVATGFKAFALASIALLLATVLVKPSGGLTWWSLAPLGLLNLAAACTASVQRGIAVGRRRYSALFIQLALTGSVQVSLLALAFGLGAESVRTLALITGVAPLLGVAGAALIGVRPGRTDRRLNDAERRSAIGSLVSMSISALAAQTMHNAAIPVATRSGVPANQVGGFVGALTLGRVPLMLLNPIGAPLVPRMTAAVAHGDGPGFRRILRGMVLTCLLLAVVGSVAAYLLGEQVLAIYLGPEYTVPRFILVSVAVTSSLFLLTSFQRLALVSLDRASAAAWAWLLALVVLGAVLLSPLPIWTRLAIATPTALTVLAAILGWSVSRAMRTRLPSNSR